MSLNDQNGVLFIRSIILHQNPHQLGETPKETQWRGYAVNARWSITFTRFLHILDTLVL
jgi:hypothetical protein